MGNPLVDVALDGLRLAGVPIPPSLPSLVEMLLNDGADVVTEIPKLVGAVERLGGDVWDTLETVASGIARYGPTGYVERLVEAHFAPQVETVKTIHSGKPTLTAVHIATLKNVNTLLTSLAVPTTASVATVPVAFTGPAADAMTARFTTISTSMTALTNALDTSQQIDNDLITELHVVLIAGIAIALLDVVLLAVAVVLAAPTLGGSLALDGGLVTAEIVALLGALAICFVIWAARHALLAITTSLAQSHTQTQTGAGATTLQAKLISDPELTPGQTEAANELFREFGGRIGIAWIKWLLGALGAGIGLEDAKAIIRCLVANGYMDAAFTGAWNSVSGHLTPRDLQGAWAEKNGIDTGFNHEKEMEDAETSLKNLMATLDSRIADFRTPAALRAVYKVMRNACQDTVNFIDKVVNGKATPSTWDNGGEVPYFSDIIAGSPCGSVTAAQYPPAH